MRSAPKWWWPVLLLSGQSSLYAWVVQRDDPGVWFMAGWGAQCAVSIFPLPPWTNWLLLSAASLFTAGLHQSKVTTSRAHQVAWPSLQFLPKIPLWTKLHWAILGCGKISFPFHGTRGNHGGNGKKCHILLGWHSFASNPKVSAL